MKILIAEDNVTSLKILEKCVGDWGFEIVSAQDGEKAMQILSGESAPQIALLDWIMPNLTGLEVCKKIRDVEGERCVTPLYIIMLTVKDKKTDIVEGLDSGANDYITKPFDNDELRARVMVGKRVVELQQKLAKRVQELEAACGHVELLQELLPICSYCKKIRKDDNYWHRVEDYLAMIDVSLTHTICPECYENQIKQMKDLFVEKKKGKEK